MSTIEDKLLDGPTVHYCDADNDDIRSDEEDDNVSDAGDMTRNDVSSLFKRPQESDNSSHSNLHRQPSCSTNTGPKGVIEDYRKQSISKPSIEDDLEAEFQALLNDDAILKEIASKRMSAAQEVPTFGLVSRLQTGSELLDAIDKENPNVLIIVLIYKKFSRTCNRVDRYLDQLASSYKHIKFLTLDASVAGLSENFKENGVPALLAYKNTDLVKSIVQIEDLIDKDFGYEEIRDLLKDNGLLY